MSTCGKRDVKCFFDSDYLLKVVLAHLSVWEKVTKATFTSIFVRLTAASGKIPLVRVGKAKNVVRPH